MGLLITNISLHARDGTQKAPTSSVHFLFWAAAFPKDSKRIHRCILPMAPSAAALRPSEPPGGASVPARQIYVI